MLRLPQGRLPPAYWVSRLYFCSLLISNTKARKPVVTVGASGKWKTGPGSCRFSRFHTQPSCGESSRTSTDPNAPLGPIFHSCPVSHSFHTHITTKGKEE